MAGITDELTRAMIYQLHGAVDFLLEERGGDEAKGRRICLRDRVEAFMQALPTTRPEYVRCKRCGREFDVPLQDERCVMCRDWVATFESHGMGHGHRVTIDSVGTIADTLRDVADYIDERSLAGDVVELAYGGNVNGRETVHLYLADEDVEQEES